MDPAILAANERMVYVTGDKEAIRAYERYQMALSDRTSEINYARDVAMKRGMKKGIQEGRTVGKAEGRVEGILEIAGKMKNAGRPFSEIAEFTGLPLDSIEKL